MSNIISIFANESKGGGSTTLLLYDMIRNAFSIAMIHFKFKNDKLDILVAKHLSPTSFALLLRMIILLYSEYLAHIDRQCDLGLIVQRKCIYVICKNMYRVSHFIFSFSLRFPFRSIFQSTF